ncbi:MAG: hypothetical protein AB199_02950 [Parcubacteria bacterium C7867-004]|nr:MAG: hypothetical protein AB199_02950 [Parcubacteria bacterium C7867-004]
MRNILMAVFAALAFASTAKAQDLGTCKQAYLAGKQVLECSGGKFYESLTRLDRTILSEVEIASYQRADELRAQGQREEDERRRQQQWEEEQRQARQAYRDGISSAYPYARAGNHGRDYLDCTVIGNRLVPACDYMRVRQKQEQGSGQSLERLCNSGPNAGYYSAGITCDRWRRGVYGTLIP